MAKRKTKKTSPLSVPTTITLIPAAYDEILALIRWADATPASVEMSDHTWEDINSQMIGPVEASLPDVTGDDLEPCWCISVETEGDRLVAILEDGETGDEVRVPLLRG